MNTVTFILLVGTMFLPLLSSGDPGSSNTAIIGGFSSTFSDGDTISLYLANSDAITGSDTDRRLRATEYYSIVKQGSFHFEVRLPKKIMHFSLVNRNGRNKILDNFLLTAGDSVFLSVASNHMSFSGVGVEKFACRQRMDSAMMLNSRTVPDRLQRVGKRQIDQQRVYMESAIVSNEMAMEVLSEFSQRLSPEIYNLLHLYTVGKSNHSAISAIRFLFSNHNFDIHDNDATDSLKRLLRQSASDISHIPDKLVAMSRDYILYMYDKLALEYAVDKIEPPFFYTLKSQLSAGVLEKLLTYDLMFSDKYYQDADSLITDALTIIKNPSYREILEELRDDVHSKRRAFNFSLHNPQEEQIELSDFYGKVVFVDFWFTGCAPCMFYYKNTVSKAKEFFRGNDEVVFISVSTDRNRDKWLNSIEAGQYTSSDIINLYLGGGLGNDHEVIQKYHITSYPAPFLIDRTGAIVTNNMQLLSGEQLKRTIEKAISANF